MVFWSKLPDEVTKSQKLYLYIERERERQTDIQKDIESECVYERERAVYRLRGIRGLRGLRVL